MKWTPTIFSNIEELKSELEARHTLWHSLQEWKDLKEQYEKMLWNDIKIDEISATSDHYQKIANRLLRTLPANPIVEELKELVETFKEAMPIVKACRAEELLSEHWDAINDLIPNGKIDIEREDFTLLSLIELEVNEYQDDIVAISRRAIGEAKLKVDLSKL
jgi:dynein heavy chain